MRIENHTRYETAPLRELARRVAEAELDPEKRRRLTVRFKEPHHGVTSGPRPRAAPSSASIRTPSRQGGGTGPR